MNLGNKVSNNKMKLAIFHPTEPKLIIAFTRNIRVYNLTTKAGHDNKYYFSHQLIKLIDNRNLCVYSGWKRRASSQD